MPLPWVRLDSNIASHDKILAVIEQKNGYRAAFAYVCGLGYCGSHATDGLIPFSALPYIHATRAVAEQLVEVRLWEPHPMGWTVRNWALRQELEAVTEDKRARQRLGGIKGNCLRYHGPSCGCWKEHIGESVA